MCFYRYCFKPKSLELNLENMHTHICFLQQVKLFGLDAWYGCGVYENISRLESTKLFGLSYERRIRHQEPKIVTPPLICQELKPRSENPTGETSISNLDIPIALWKEKCSCANYPILHHVSLKNFQVFRLLYF